MVSGPPAFSGRMRNAQYNGWVPARAGPVAASAGIAWSFSRSCDGPKFGDVSGGWSGWFIEKAHGLCREDGSHAVVDSELAVDVSEVVVDGPWGDGEAPCDCLGRTAAAEEDQDSGFATGETGLCGAGCSLVAGCGDLMVQQGQEGLDPPGKFDVLVGEVLAAAREDERAVLAGAQAVGDGQLLLEIGRTKQLDQGCKVLGGGGSTRYPTH